MCKRTNPSGEDRKPRCREGGRLAVTNKQAVAARNNPQNRRSHFLFMSRRKRRLQNSKCFVSQHLHEAAATAFFPAALLQRMLCKKNR